MSRTPSIKITQTPFQLTRQNKVLGHSTQEPLQVQKLFSVRQGCFNEQPYMRQIKNTIKDGDQNTVYNLPNVFCLTPIQAKE